MKETKTFSGEQYMHSACSPGSEWHLGQVFSVQLEQELVPVLHSLVVRDKDLHNPAEGFLPARTHLEKIKKKQLSNGEKNQLFL